MTVRQWDILWDTAQEIETLLRINLIFDFVFTEFTATNISLLSASKLPPQLLQPSTLREEREEPHSVQMICYQRVNITLEWKTDKNNQTKCNQVFQTLTIKYLISIFVPGIVNLPVFQSINIVTILTNTQIKLLWEISTINLIFSRNKLLQLLHIKYLVKPK